MTDYADMGRHYSGVLVLGKKEYSFILYSQEVIFDSYNAPMMKMKVNVFDVDKEFLLLERTDPGQEEVILRMGDTEYRGLVDWLSIDYDLTGTEYYTDSPPFASVSLSFVSKLFPVPAKKEIMLMNRFDLMDLE